MHYGLELSEQGQSNVHIKEDKWTCHAEKVTT